MGISAARIQRVVARGLDGLLVFGAGALLDPSVASYIGQHRAVGTGIGICVAGLRALDKSLGGKAAAAATTAAHEAVADTKTDKPAELIINATAPPEAGH